MACILLYPIAVLLHAALTSAVCEDTCDPIATLLSQCSLPPLSTDFGSIGEPRGLRLGGYLGRYVYFANSTDKAACFCSKARDHCEDCMDCFDNNGGTKQNDAEITDTYRSDWHDFGYFVDDERAYPSTTRDALPSSTATAEAGAKCNDGDTCTVVRDQVTECGLTAFDNVNSSMGIADHYNKLYKSRKEAECLYTVPVLQAFEACEVCMDEVKPEVEIQSDLVSEYRLQCFPFGYYGEAKAQVSASKTSEGAGPAETSASTKGGEKDAAGLLWDRGIVLLLGVSVALSVLWSFI